MRLPVFLVAAAVAALSTTAAANETSTSDRAPAQGREVMICDADAATSRAFAREYGEAPRFMTAEELRDAQARGERWDTPRCITATEHQRLRQQARAGR